MSRDGHGFGPPVSQRLPFQAFTRYSAKLCEELIAVHHEVARPQLTERTQHLEIGAQFLRSQLVGQRRRRRKRQACLVDRAQRDLPSIRLRCLPHTTACSRNSISEHAFNTSRVRCTTASFAGGSGSCAAAPTSVGYLYLNPISALLYVAGANLSPSRSTPAPASRRAPRPRARWEWSAPDIPHPAWGQSLPSR